jgi:GNAT superfamily N-acetyltransferase
LEDITQIQSVKNSVRENMLSDPGLVTGQDCEEYLFNRGKGWVCDVDGEIVGFAIVDLSEHNLWALFVHPDHEAKGIGKQLHELMTDWYFLQTKQTIWLGTAPGTRAEKFYRLKGWEHAGTHGSKEIRLEMGFEAYRNKHNL